MVLSCGMVGSQMIKEGSKLYPVPSVRPGQHMAATFTQVKSAFKNTA